MDEKYEVNGQMSIFDLNLGIPAVSMTPETAPAPAPGKTDYEIESEKGKVAKEFGEHIGGSRKELFASGNFDMAVMDMNDAERDKFIVKDKLWKKPNYDAMIADGMEPLVAFCIKKIRDAVPAKPSVRYRHDKKDEQILYIKFVGIIKTIAEGITSTDDFLDNPSVADSYGIIDHSQSSRFYKTPGEICGGNMNNSLLRVLYPTTATLKALESEMRKVQFGVAKAEKVPTGYTVRQNSDSTYFVAKGYRILLDGFATRTEAVKAAQELAAQSKKAAKSKFVPPQLDHVERVGLTDYRNGKHVTGEDFIKDFKIRGGEFGNWMSEKDAQANLDMCYDAFCDLATVWGCGNEGVSVGGKMAIAFGARGHGNAVAHYEPLREVINLTKMRGAGSLAHEMFHGLDDILGKATVGMAFTEAYSNYKLKGMIPAEIKEVFEAMLHSPMSEQEKAALLKRRFDRAEWELNYMVKKEVADSFLTDEQKAERDSVTVSAIEKIKACREQEELEVTFDEFTGKLDAIVKASSNKLDALTDKVKLGLYSPVCGIYFAAVDSTGNFVRDSDFLENSRKMDKSVAKEKHGYWASLCEMFARAGACFVTDELKRLGAKNDYLSGHSECCTAGEYDRNGNKIGTIYAMPRGEERERINAAFRKMLASLFLNK